MKKTGTTRFIKTEDANRKWFVIDAENQVLGRLAVKAASIIRGKHKAIFTPNMDTGDFVIVVNADKVKLTGKRESMKTYFSHSGYPGGVRIRTFSELKEKNPEFVVWHAVKGMLPKKRLGRKLIKKLKIYRGADHPHSAQKPETLSIQ